MKNYACVNKAGENASTIENGVEGCGLSLDGDSLLPESSGNTSAEQTVIFVIDYVVTFANSFFQSLAVEDGYGSANILDQFFFSQFPRSHRYPFAANTDHI